MNAQSVACGQGIACGQDAACGNETGCESAAVSPALAAAQIKLEQLRLDRLWPAHRSDQPDRTAEKGERVKDGRLESSKNPDAHQTRPTPLPPHLGWHSAPAADAYRRALKNREKEQRAEQQSFTPSSSTSKPLPPPQPEAPPTSEAAIKVLPDIALAILREKLAAPGRVWLLLRYMDEDGRGWISAGTARKRLTGKKSPLKICGPRQLRNLLTAGESIFWERDDERIWLKSMAKVAAELGVSRLSSRAVELPVSVLLDSIGTVRAHLYATFHSGRNGGNAGEDGRSGKPISRETLKSLSSATRRTQRLYEKRAGVGVQTNYAIGCPYSVEAEQNMAWEHGPAVFGFEDRQGLVGQSGRRYLAWQLPNSYDGVHNTLPKGYQRRLNRQLADLLNEGITGNGEEKAIGGPGDGCRTKVFHRNGSTAAKAYNRSPEQDLYWKSRMKRRPFTLWHALPALGRKKQ